MKHCILIKYKQEVTEDQRQALFPEIKQLFEGLTVMEGIHGVELIPNVIDRPNRYDLLIRIDMEQEVLPAYNDSAIHHRWKEEYGKYLEKKAIFDYM